MRTCKECEFEGKCCYSPKYKMFRGKCYIDEITEKTKRKGKTILDFHMEFTKLVGVEIQSYAEYINRAQIEEWTVATETEKRKIVACTYPMFNQAQILLLVATVNSYLDTWHTGKVIRCKQCGRQIENNSRHNRQYCDRCKGYHQKDNREKYCIDCGCYFEATFSNRSVRCEECQEKATREKARIRKQKQRAKMRCHDLERKE